MNRRFFIATVRCLQVMAAVCVLPAIAQVPGDVDGDRNVTEFDRVLLTEHILGVTPLKEFALGRADLNADGVLDVADQVSLARLLETLPTRLFKAAPADGETGVAVTRETVLTFSQPLDPLTAVYGNISAKIGDTPIAGQVHLSPDGLKATVFYDAPMPGGAAVRVTIDGDALLDHNGMGVDGDGDGAFGGVGHVDFNTLPLATLEGTSVHGRVFASELGEGPGGIPSVNVPLEGVTIRVDGLEDTVFAVTDVMGDFVLEPVPAGRFFVHIDGTTVTEGVPPGAYYPTVGKPFESTAGRDTSVGDIFLPLVAEGTLQPVSASQDTVLTFVPSVLAAFPEFIGTRIIVPADSLYADDGTRGGMVGISPVPPDRIPGALPAGLEFPLVITVQTDGPTNFDEPVAACFPNLVDPILGTPLPAGSDQYLYSFNHDSGTWEGIGPMTVTLDGALVCTDPGVGILAPGWHGVAPVPVNRPPWGPSICKDDTDALTNCKNACDLDNAKCKLAVLGAFAAVRLGCLLTGPWSLVCGAVAGAVKLAAELGCETANSLCKGECNSRYLNCGGLDVSSALTAISDLDFGTVEAVGARAESTPVPVPGNPLLSLIGRSSPAPLGADPTIDQINTLYDQAIALTNPYLMGGMEPPQETMDQADALMDDADAAAGGDALSYLRAAQLAAEEGFASVQDLVGEYQGNTPEYPILFMAEIYRAGGELLRIRGETMPRGGYSIFVPRDGELQFVSQYDPLTDTWGVAYPNRRPGAITPIPHVYLASVDGLADYDGDGLVDVAEFVVGTETWNSDTDGDGIGDKVELEAGTNPLDGLPVIQGIVATAAAPGSAVSICVHDALAAVALDDDGIALYNVFNGTNPRLIAVVDTPGLALGVACDGDFVAVADGAASAAIIDVSDPPEASVVHSVSLPGGEVSRVAAQGGLAYFALTSGRIYTVDLKTGAVLDRLNLPIEIADLSLASGILSVVGQGRLVLLELLGGLPNEIGEFISGRVVSEPDESHVFNGFPVAYFTHFFGVYDTVDISDPANPTSLGISGLSFGNGRAITANGSGTVIATYFRAGSTYVTSYDDTDHTVTDLLIQEVLTPGSATDVAISNGLAYVTDGNAGIHVYNYLSYDNMGIPPAITLIADFSLSPAEVEEGKRVRVAAEVSDDVQVRNVEFYIDGNLAFNDVSFPFEYAFTTPRLADQGSFTLRAEATDTGGNTTSTAEYDVTLLADVTPPVVALFFPDEGAFIGAGDPVIAIFNEPIDAATLTDLSFDVTAIETEGGAPAPGFTLDYRPEILAAFLEFESDPVPGSYLASVGPPLADLAGNAMATPTTWTFEVPVNTAVEGLVQLEDLTPVDGAEVSVVGFEGAAATGGDGHFLIDTLTLPFGNPFTVVAQATVGPDTLFGSAPDLIPVHDGLTDAGTITLAELCEPALAEGLFTVPGIIGGVRDMALFDDGGGLALYAAGALSIAGDTEVAGVAKWDGEKWSPVGGFGADVRAIEVYDDGGGPALYAGSTDLYRWTGSVWEQVGSGLSGSGNTFILSMAVFDGELYIGGLFLSASGVDSPGIARWNGTSFSAVGDALSNDPFQVNIDAMAVWDDGSGAALYVGGNVAQAGSLVVNGIARWNGSAWSDLAGGVMENAQVGSVRALQVYDDGGGSRLYAGGGFTHSGGVQTNGIAAWDGASWSALNMGIKSGGADVRSLAVFDDGMGDALFAGGTFTMASGVTVNHIAKWDGAAWTALGTGVTNAGSGFGGIGVVDALQVFDDGSGAALYAGGYFFEVGATGAQSIARWDGSDWTSLTPGLDDYITDLAVWDDGGGEDLYAFGQFLHDGSNEVMRVGRWTGSGWAPVGGGVGVFSPSSQLNAIAGLSNTAEPSLFVGGTNLRATAGTYHAVLRFDGADWLQLGSGMAGLVSDLLAFDDGGDEDLYIGGEFGSAGGVPASRIVRWDGTEFSALGDGFNNSVYALAVFDDGSGPALYAGGFFTFSGDQPVNRIARWNGVSWEPLGSGLNSLVDQLEVFDDGTGAALYVGGSFTSAGGVSASGIAKWDGKEWSATGAFLRGPMAVFDDGTGEALYAANAVGQNHVHKWDGVNWTSPPALALDGGPLALHAFDDGTGPALFIGGSFSGTDTLVSWKAARYARPYPPCPGK